MTATPTNAERKWTKEPWRQSTRGPDGCPIIGSKGRMIAKLALSVNEDGQAEEAEATAIRIVSCVNFLAAHPDLTRSVVLPVEVVAKVREALEFAGAIMPKDKLGNRSCEKIREALALLPSADVKE